ncbi:hypothetical protein [Rickettsia rickettsii]|uniref:hypothetical protein n=1 Tax=Rickettsia rickettsii TaxID=783 RepID=UPI000045E7A0|nr:hypothetical protein [Rickettsia rickettsii]AJG35158.1 hypothetical protein RRM_05845 [Rickettsia rickettsii str. Morgan]USD85229.1 hypothetical protein NDY50_05910 [Rickettsia rickettsii]USD86554.1 hypothetical protein NDY48_05825 [Rickettsia rickettsii]USD87867.1 hypothetical protein NDY49_05870 [Rickettsia rickettsii]WGQ95287.1 hypothetical protein QBX69_05910 [Rickettsia rickettsii str. 'Sheila Smith']
MKFLGDLLMKQGRYRQNTQLVLFTKSKKVVVVGDPLQTDPISILKQDLMHKLCEHFKVSYPEWSPSEVSLQNLADRNSLYQTKIDDVTVSVPL